MPERGTRRMRQSSDVASFGAVLRAHRLRLGLTQEVLAERAGLSRRGIADLERGARSAPYPHTRERLSAALGLSESERETFREASRHPKRPRGPQLEPVHTGWSVEGANPHDNLPFRPSSFISRQRERSEVADRLTSSPLVTLVGPGGVGKRASAIEVAATVGDRFPDGVWLVGFAPLSDADLVPQSIADVLGVRQRAGVDVATSLAGWLRPKRMLLVLDNCEHVVEACAHLSSQLIRACPPVRLLATSREILGVDGETITRVDPLTVPGGPLSLETVLESDAVRLLVDRALAAAPGFALTEQNAPTAVKICQRLDGLPLGP